MSERQALSQLRRWCPYSKTHRDLNDPECDCCEQDYGGYHLTRKRRMLICSVPDCQQGYFTQKEFQAHECHSAY